MMASLGEPGEDAVALLGRERLVDAAGDDPSRMDALAGEHLDDLLAELAQADAVAQRPRGSSGATPKMLRCAGSAVQAEQEVGRGEVEEAQRVATG